MILLNAYRRDQRGSTAAEFALILPVFVALILAVIHFSMVVYAAVELHDATEWTARCVAVSANNPSGATTTCAPNPTAAQVLAYGQGRYTGPKITPTFQLVTSPTVSCTNSTQISGSGTYRMWLGVASVSVPINAKACFPYSPAT